MLEFTSAVLTDEAEAEREAKIVNLMKGIVDEKVVDEEGNPKPSAPPMSREDAESIVDDDPYTDFMLDGRQMRAYQPTSGQLAFMMASMGRGQTSDQRFSAILNIMFECLRDDDKDHLESRMLTRDKKKRLDLVVLERIFEGLAKEWFARPIQ